ncbi:hypothetical protein LJC68_06720 [Bacteroidales bacterium OttesenSCG-928-B11]|nr:hypothetical protein [Bacteroidales bacterium OttesenSCG-928-B11]
MENQKIKQPNFQESITKGILAIFSTLISYSLVALLVTYFYNPDVESLRAISNEVLILGGSNPEPKESLLFRLGVLLIPLFLLLYFYILNTPRLSKIKWNKFFLLSSILFLLFTFAVFFIGFKANNPNYVEVVQGNNYANSRDTQFASNFDFYFNESIINQNIGTYITVFLFVFLLPLIIYRFYPKIFENRGMRVVGYVLVSAFAVFYFYQVYSIFHFEFPYTWENKYDFNVIYYPMTQVYAGSPMLVDGFAANYGLYAHFLAPIFKFTELNISSFTAVMALLIVLLYSMILVSMFRLIKNKLIILLGFTTALYIPFLLFRLITPFDAQFAAFPIRMFFPALTVFLASFYVYNKNKVLYFTTFILLSIGVLWNPEFGIVSIVAWLLTLCYMEFKSDDKKKIIRGCIKHFLVFAGSLVVVFLVYSLLIYWVYGAFPHVIDLLNSMIYFSSLGFYLLPMKLVHPWNFVVLIYIVGLAYAIYALFKKEQLTEKTSFIFLLSILGVGMFFYFQGRSHNWTLISVTINIFLLLSIFAEMLFAEIRKKKNTIIYSIPFTLIIFILGFSICDLFGYQDKMEELHAQKKDQKNNLTEDKRVKTNIKFISSLAENTTDEIFIHTSNKYQSLYFAPVKKKSAFNPSIIDIFTKENCERLKNKVMKDSLDIFIETASFYYPYVQPTNAAMTATYSVDTTNGSIVLLKKRPSQTLPELILDKNASEALFYDHFEEDTNSINKRIDYAINGCDSIAWGDDFSIELVFYAEKQAYVGGTLFSNFADSAGLQLFNNNTPSQYFIQWGKNLGTVINLSQNRWHYLVLQFSNNNLNIYDNGMLIVSGTIPEHPDNSFKSMHIANHHTNNLHFTGLIREFLIKNGSSSVEDIQKNGRLISAM